MERVRGTENCRSPFVSFAGRIIESHPVFDTEPNPRAWRRAETLKLWRALVYGKAKSMITQLLLRMIAVA